jgi:hypothetical protein
MPSTHRIGNEPIIDSEISAPAGEYAHAAQQAS